MKRSETILKDWGLSLLQPEEGYRFSVDSLLIAEFCTIPKDARILDIGTGCGVIALIMARRSSWARVTAIDIQEDLYTIARENVERNRLQERIEVIRGDIKDASAIFKAGSFDLVVTNPPYRPAFSGRICPNAQEALSRHEIYLDLETLLDNVRYVLRPGGYLALVFPAERCAELIEALGKRRIQPKRIQFVHPGPDQEARLVLIESVKDAKRGVRILPPQLLNHAP